jgi:hypothetical protein
MRRWLSSKKQEISEVIKDDDLYAEAIDNVVQTIKQKAEFLIML